MQDQRSIKIYVFFVVSLLLSVPLIGLAAEPQSGHHAEQLDDACAASATGLLDSVQIETSDLKSFEIFFGDVLKAPLIERRDHPDKDSVRGYCYQGIRIVVRQDHAAPRRTGWVQINFTVPDVDAVLREIERANKNSTLALLSDTERDKIVRIRLKPDVRRGNRKATRLEVAGPEGFMIGFNQYKGETPH